MYAKLIKKIRRTFVGWKLITQCIKVNFDLEYAKVILESFTSFTYFTKISELHFQNDTPGTNHFQSTMRGTPCQDGSDILIQVH